MNRRLAGVAVTLTLLLTRTSQAQEPAELEAFFDGAIGAQLDTLHIAGAAVVVVHKGSTLLAKGYGFENVARRRPVDPHQTMFRIGSITKLFTATAVMQLAEDGKLDLDSDVNRHLQGLPIPATHAEPITLRHLLGHTAGFEDRVIGLFAHGPEDLDTLESILRERMPARVRPPGQLASYSNFGMALAGLVVERASGSSWESYVEQRILEPLGMRSTTMRQPVPSAQRSRLSNGYTWSDGRFRSRPFGYVTLAPAASASSTASDMARFMIMHLSDGEAGGSRLLSTESARRMREPLFTPDPRLGSMLHGFYELRRHPVRVIGHAGDAFAFHSLLLLIPEHGLGLFVTFNSESGATARSSLLDSFLDRYYPDRRSLNRVPEGADARVREVRGTYVSTRLPDSSFTRLAALFQAIEVEAETGGRIVVTGPSANPIWMVEQEPYLFRETLGHHTIAFRSTRGATTHAFFDNSPMVGFLRVGPLQTKRAQGIVLTAAATVFLTSIAASVMRRIRKRPVGFAGICTASFSVLFLSFGYLVARALRDTDSIAFGLPWWVKLSLWLPVLAAPLWVAAAVSTSVAWRWGSWTIGTRLHRTLVVLAGGLFIVWLLYWNLLDATALW